MSPECAVRSCWYSARISLLSLGVEMTRTWLPVFFAQASAPDLHRLNSIPTEPQAMETVVCADADRGVKAQRERAAEATTARRESAGMGSPPMGAKLRDRTGVRRAGRQLGP